MSSKVYKVSSEGGLWLPYEVTVNKEGYVEEVSNRDSEVVIGSSFQSLIEYWKKFEGDYGYRVESINNVSGE